MLTEFGRLLPPAEEFAFLKETYALRIELLLKSIDNSI
jgi:hypothetical protein